VLPKPLLGQALLLPHQMLDNHLVQSLIVAVGDEFLGGLFVEGARFVEQSQEGAPAVHQVVHIMFRFGRAKRMDIETDVLAFFAVTIPLQRAHLVEGATQVCVSKRTVLIVFQPVLVIEVQLPEFVERHREIDFIGRVKPGENGVRSIDQAADAMLIGR